MKGLYTWVFISAVAIGFAGCSDKKSSASGDDPASETPLEAVTEPEPTPKKPPVEKTAASPADAGAPEVDDSDEPPAAGTLHGYVVANDFLWALTPPAPGEAAAKVKRYKAADVGPVAWCSVDRAARMVWIHGRGGLHAYDLDTRKFEEVVMHGDKGPFAGILLEYGGIAPAQFAEHDEPVVLLHIEAKKRTFGPRLECDNTQLDVCYSKHRGEDRSTWTLSEAMEGQKERAETARLVGGGVLRTAMERAKTYKAREAPSREPPQAPTIEFDRSSCEVENKGCGEATWVGGRFWKVMTANKLEGNFYSETSQIWDSRSKEFVNPNGWVRSREPFPDAVGEHEIVTSADLRFAFVNGSLIDLNTGRYLWGRGETKACGWASDG